MTDYSVDPLLVTGIDVGGTKVHIADTASATIRRYETKDFDDMYALLAAYFASIGRRPEYMVLAMAGPRDDETGNVTLTNAHWPMFSPDEAAKRFPGTTFETINDMIGTAAGILQESGIDLIELHTGRPAPTGTKLIMALSTGIGSAAAVWDKRMNRHIFMASEGGHIGFHHPKNDAEAAYLGYLQNKHEHVSVELALSGKHGIDSLVEHSLALLPTDALAPAVDRVKQNGSPVGAVIFEFAEQDGGPDGDAARAILYNLGNMLGSVARDYAIAFKATGGVYLTGSMAMSLGEYFAGKTDFINRFAHPGAQADEWTQHIPIYLVTDPNVAVKGALALAEEN